MTQRLEHDQLFDLAENVSEAGKRDRTSKGRWTVSKLSIVIELSGGLVCCVRCDNSTFDANVTVVDWDVGPYDMPEERAEYLQERADVLTQTKDTVDEKKFCKVLY